MTSLIVPFMEGLSAFDYLDFVASIVSTVGLYGFAFYKRIGDVVFWKYFFLFVFVESVVISIVFPTVGLPTYGEVAQFDGVLAFNVSYTSVLLWALYQYAYKRPFIWTRGYDST